MKLKLQLFLLVLMILLCACGYMLATGDGSDSSNLINVILYSVGCLVSAWFADKAEV